MRALHIVPGLDPRDGGPAYSVPRLCSALREAGCGADMLAVGNANTPVTPGLRCFPGFLQRAPILRGLRFSPALRRAGVAEAAQSDVVHAHGLWLMPNVYAGHAAAHAGKPLVISPRGMLAAEALAFSPRKKRLFWHLLQRRAYAGAGVWHATCAQEAGEFRAFGITEPIAIIPNGIDLPEGTALHAERTSQRTLLFMSRLHPKKGLPILLEAWARLAPLRPEWRLVIAGPDEAGHRAELEKTIRARAIPGVSMPGPVSGEAKQALLLNADLFVLPTLNENFGIAVAEALAFGIPAIVTKGAPWQGLDSEACGWWIEHGVEPLLAALLEATALPSSARRDMGLRGREWMARDFGWPAIGRQMAEVYRWLLGEGPQPACVVDAEGGKRR